MLWKAAAVFNDAAIVINKWWWWCWWSIDDAYLESEHDKENNEVDSGDCIDDDHGDEADDGMNLLPLGRSDDDIIRSNATFWPS